LYLLRQVADVQPAGACGLCTAAVGQRRAGSVGNRLGAALGEVVAAGAQCAGRITGADAQAELACENIGVVGRIIGRPACVGWQDDEAAGTIRVGLATKGTGVGKAVTKEIDIAVAAASESQCVFCIF